MYENEGVLNVFPNYTDMEIYNKEFVNDKYLFRLGTLNIVLESDRREMKSDFGILPFSKCFTPILTFK